MSELPNAFDKNQLAPIDISLRAMVDRSYDLCIHQCNMQRDAPQFPCKQSCFKKITIPYRHANHIARDNEETLYRKCLGNSANFPNL